MVNFFKKINEEENEIKNKLDELKKKCQENIHEIVNENKNFISNIEFGKLSDT